LAKAGTQRRAARPEVPGDRELGLLCAQLARERQARDVRLLFVGDTLGIADWFVLATVNNRRQARAVRDAIRVALREAGAGVPQAASEDPDGRWSLYDYGGVVVHLFDDEGRANYGLDDRWRGSPEVELPEDAPAPRAAGRHADP
jgi:ribosome-associated protein